MPTSIVSFTTASSGLRRLLGGLLRRSPSARASQPDLLNALIGGLTGSRHDDGTPRRLSLAHFARRIAPDGRGGVARPQSDPDGARSAGASAGVMTAPASRERARDRERNRRRTTPAEVPQPRRVEASDPRQAAPYIWAQAVAEVAGIDLEQAVINAAAAPRTATPQTMTPAPEVARPLVWAPAQRRAAAAARSSVAAASQAPRRVLRLAGAFSLLAAVAVSGAACRSADDPNVIRLNGRLEAALVDIAPKVAGRVSKVLVREGDRVKAGDLLITLDLGETALAVDRDRAGVDSAQARARDMEAGSRRSEISAAEADVVDRTAAVDLAKRELERQQFLLGRKVGTERDTDRAKTDLDRAQAALHSSRDRLQLTREGFRKWQTTQARTEVSRAQAQLRQSETVAGEAELRAPADAVVLHRIAEPGLLLAAGQSGLTLAFTDRLYVRTFVPETKLGQVKQGGAAEVIVDAFPGRTFPGRVTEISLDAEFTPKAVETRAERVNLVYAAKVDLDRGWKEPLVPGQPAEVVVRLQAGAAAPSSGAAGSGTASGSATSAPGATATTGAATTPNAAQPPPR
jgi:HlyD family secretion protein